MSNQALTWAYKQDVYGPAKAVLIALANRANEEGCCFPGVPTIARDAGFCVRTVQNALKRLREVGAVEVTPRKRNGVATSSNYQLPVEAIRAANQARQIVVHEAHQVVHDMHHRGAPAAPGGAGAAEEPSLTPQIKPSSNQEPVAAGAAASATEAGKAISDATAPEPRTSPRRPGGLPLGAGQQPLVKKPPTIPTATRLPEEWRPNESGVTLARDEGLDFDRVLATFRDHWRAASGSNARKCDWDATWANWCRREGDRRARMHAGPPAAGQAGTRPRYETVSERRGRDLAESMRGNRYSRRHRHEATEPESGFFTIEGKVE